MAPQVPDQTTPAVSSPTEDLKAKAAEAAEAAKKLDAFQRSQTDRKRGWHDYQLLVSGVGEGLVVNTLSTVSTDLNTYNEDSFNGWNSFNVNGETQIANFVSAPPSYGRFPNYKATDRAIQATDGAIIFVKPSPWTDTVDYNFEPVKNSYEGKNVSSYDDMWSENTPVSAPTTKELSVMNERTRRPVALVILATSEGFYTQPNYRNYEDSLKALRVACAKFMKDYGDSNQVRLFEINDENDKEGLNKVVSLLISDLQEGKGIQFEPPKVRPWDAKKENKFDQLNVKGSSKTGNKTSFWNKITKALRVR